MGLVQTKFKAWIARRLLTPPLADRFELHHISQGVSSLVCCLNSDSHDGDMLAAALCRQVTEEVTEHVAGLEGRQQYVVRAFVGDKPSAEFPFWEYCASLSHGARQLAQPIPEASENSGDISLQKAVAMMMNQQLRHTEAITVQLVDVVTKTKEYDTAQIASLRAHVERLDNRRFETHELLESLLGKAAERDFERQKFETEQAHKEAMFGTIMEKVVPGLAHAWGLKLPPVAGGANGAAASGGTNGAAPNGGANGGAASSDAEESAGDKNTATIKRLFSTLPEEMQNSILENLGEERASELMTAFGYPPRSNGASN